MTARHLLALAILAIIGLILVWNVNEPGTPQTTKAPERKDNALGTVYQGDGFSIRLPKEYHVEEGQPGAGVVLVIASSTWTGTNLASDTHVGVRNTREPAACSAGLFLNDRPVTPYEWTDGDVTYSVASSTDAAAGSRVEMTFYALPETNPCLVIYYFIRYGAIENYPEGTVKEFDKAALLREFDAIRRTLVVAE